MLRTVPFSFPVLQTDDPSQNTTPAVREVPKKQKSVANRRGEDSEEATGVPKDKSVVAKKVSTGSTSSASASSMSSPPPAYPSAEMREKSPENERVTSDKSEQDDKVKVTDFRCVIRFFQDSKAICIPFRIWF